MAATTIVVPQMPALISEGGEMENLFIRLGFTSYVASILISDIGFKTARDFFFRP